MNAWLRHVQAAFNPELDDAWLVLLTPRDRTTSEIDAVRAEQRQRWRSGPIGMAVAPPPRGPTTRPRPRH